MTGRIGRVGRFIIAAAAAALAAPAFAEPAAFASPDAAVDAIIAALGARDRAALIAVFGPEAEDVALSGEDARDRETWRSFLEAYKAMHRVAIDETGASATLFIGTDQWPFPAPIVKGDDGRWRFDAEAAREEVLARRIGENELDVIELLGGYVRAQQQFRLTDFDDDGVMEFASAVISDPGERNGLYWPPEEGAPDSPIGDFMARAADSGYNLDGEDRPPDPYLGYYFKVLTAQGPEAPGGAYDFRVNGNMVAGHALFAFPADYGASGIMSFMVGESGTVYEADLGEETLEAAAAVDRFVPDDAWTPVD